MSNSRNKMYSRRFYEKLKNDPEKLAEYKRDKRERDLRYRENLKKDSKRLEIMRKNQAERSRLYRHRKMLEQKIQETILVNNKNKSTEENPRGLGSQKRQLEKVEQMFEAALPKDQKKRETIKKLFLEKLLINYKKETPQKKIARTAKKFVEPEIPLKKEPNSTIEIDGLEIKEEDELNFFDNVNDAYCRCCFKIFTIDCNRNEIDQDFLTVIFKAFNKDMHFESGSRWICDRCQETMINFEKFRDEIMQKQNNFLTMLSRNEHEDFIAIQKLSDYVAESKVEEIVVKQEPSESSIFTAELPVVSDPEEHNNFDKLPNTIEDNEICTLPKVCYIRKKCKDCKKYFINLLNHRIKRHGHKQIFSCSACNFKADERVKVNKHIICAHGADNEVAKACEYCGKFFQYLDKHILKVHRGTKNYFCDLCSYSCYEKHSIEYHIQNCHLPKNVKCSQCNFRTINEKRLEKHVKNMHEISDDLEKLKVKCDIGDCNKIFKKIRDLKTHIKRVHQKEYTVKCDNPECTRMFFTPNEMLQHFYKIHAPKNSICDKCGACFGSDLSLRKHAVVHGDNIFDCTYCEKKFNTKTKLNDHIKRYHTFEKNYKCSELNCDAAFYDSQNLKRHIRTIHQGLRFECQVPGCKSSLSRRDAYVAHLKYHKELSKNQYDELYNKLKVFCAENDF